MISFNHWQHSRKAKVLQTLRTADMASHLMFILPEMSEKTMTDSVNFSQLCSSCMVGLPNFMLQIRWTPLL
jgi:hypothetical protein